ncbi:hypothetical protein A3L04_09525 [Thermococcus chitonophagus]|uniref:Uncharacterized protein n=1 Tax=Thermococcus chitonophagus TaxID=54262 RepID=A0A160VTQ9_9EURY|nr:hypothetical protein [Thermococcus chitonophagus]ASJ17290.1 hypothetical protein A3L04_09525 [Thermococcus chitonophagus]CUX77916.1 hypothetical protein CHITON_1137 [Thermococcus chitonophagus]
MPLITELPVVGSKIIALTVSMFFIYYLLVQGRTKQTVTIIKVRVRSRSRIEVKDGSYSLMGHPRVRIYEIRKC